ncbi:TonB-dependent receptor [Achromobacter seleniivolatilans]|uniref:TonB-dependent receptor n=2 Tax=Achromobacter seleniivolatilans TaxID=3047478 RepID=A0ABY9M3S3_9BURK|nr:TonB-dependent receptor [Achromobacter sp. R39]WMD21360.1 TonB-dependent receptor [Achromobacter sp. R39]
MSSRVSGPRACARPISATAVALCAALTLTAPMLAQAQTHATPIAFDIPSQALGAALLALGQQANLEISFVPATVAGKTAPALHGTLSPLGALDQLLRGSGLAFKGDGPGRYIIYVDKTNQFSAARLDPVKVYGEQVGERVFTKEEIANTPTSNRDLSSLVATHPAVRTNPGANSSQNRGSLNVEDISFHGSSPYQNLFQIDGMDATNRIDPASKNLNLQVGNIPSNPQSYFVDTSLLEEVRVHDSFVPVEYGRFTGGVVDAKLRRFSGENHLNLDYRWNTSKMTQQKVGDGEENSWAQGKPGYSPEWKKRFYSAVGDFAFNEKTGAVIAMSRRESDITRWNMGVDEKGLAAPGQSTYRDSIDNFLGKFSVRASADTVADLTLKYSDRSETLASDLFRNTRWDNNHAARGISANIDHLFQGGRFSLQAGWDRSLSNRESNGDELVSFKPFNLPLYTAGGFGKEQKQQDTYTLKGRIDLEPLRTGVFTHIPYAGAELQQVNAGFERFQESYSYRRNINRDGSYQDVSKVRYLPGTVDVNYNMMSVYLSDRIEWERLALDAGVRYDRETFLGNNNVSPRTRLDWDMFGSGDTLLSAGWSRYYGSQVLETALEAEISRLRRQVLDAKGKPVANGGKEYFVEYKGLRMPYDDEWAVSLRQRAAGMEGVVSYVHRNGRDQWAKTGTDQSGYQYTNEGLSTTDGVSLTLRTLEPWRLGQTRWNAQASWSWQKRKTNKDLVEGYTSDARDPGDFVLYNGSQIRAIDLPPNSFHQPQTASFSLIGAWPQTGLTWSNMLNWRSKRDAVIYVGVGPKPYYLDRYQSGQVPAYWTWDTKLLWQPTFARNLEFTVEVLNVLNRMPAVTASNPNLKTNRSTYQSGRELWLQVGYRF